MGNGIPSNAETLASAVCTQDAMHVINRNQMHDAGTPLACTKGTTSDSGDASAESDDVASSPLAIYSVLKRCFYTSLVFPRISNVFIHQLFSHEF